MSIRDRSVLRLLVVEQNATDFKLVSDQLSALSRQYITVQAGTLAEALERLRREAFDAVILDCNLPDSTGLESFHVLRARSPNVPIVVLSNTADSDLALETLESGAQDFLPKNPLTSEMLDRTVRHAIMRHGLQAQLEDRERQLRMMAEQLPAMLWTTDAQLRVSSLRGRELAVMHVQFDQAFGRPLEELFAGSRSMHSMGELHRRALIGEAVSADVEWQKHWFHVHVKPLRNTIGDLVGTIGVALDVTGEHKLRRDVQAAHQVQQHLLPAQSPRFRGYDIAGRCFPADDCSGDFFDYIPMTSKRLAIVLADVSGHGFGPAILAAAIRSYLRTAAILGNQVHEMLALGNRLLLSDGDFSPFASVVAACLDSESRELRYASAGHPAYLLRSSDEILRLDSLSMPIGVRREEVFTLSAKIRLRTGDIVLLASDGVFEARAPDGSQFGVDRALGILRAFRSEKAEDLVNRLHEAALKYTGGAALDDDLTAVVVKVIDPSGSTMETWSVN